MRFEPVIFGQFESAVQIVLNPFEPACSNGTNNYLVRHLIRELTRKLTVLCNNTARTTSLFVARAEMLVLKTASAHQYFSRREGGSK